MITMDAKQYKKSLELWIDAQKSNIEIYKNRVYWQEKEMVLVQKTLEFYKESLEHEVAVLNDAISELEKL